MDERKRLEELLLKVPSAIFITHDRAFLDNVVTSTLVFEGAAEVNEYVGGYSDWLRQRRGVGAPAAPPVALLVMALVEVAVTSMSPALLMAP